MFKIYIGSVIISYLITKSSMEKVEKELIKKNLNTKETEAAENIKRIYLLIISSIPVINILISIRSLVCKDDLYNTFRKVQCELIIKDDKELLNKYEKACRLRNINKRRSLEKKITLANSLISLGFDKNETKTKIFS